MPTTRQDGTRPPAASQTKQAIDAMFVRLNGTSAVKALNGSQNPSFVMSIEKVDEHDRIVFTQLTMVVLSSQHPDRLQFANHQNLLAYTCVFEEPNLYISMWIAGQIKPQFYTDDDHHRKVPRGFHLDVRKMENDSRAWLEVSLWRTVVHDYVHDLDTNFQPALEGSHHVHEQQHYGSEIAPEGFFKMYDKIMQMCSSKWWQQFA